MPATHGSPTRHHLKIDWQRVRVQRERFTNERLALLAETLADLDAVTAGLDPMQSMVLMVHVEKALENLTGLLAGVRLVNQMLPTAAQPLPETMPAPAS